MNKKSKIIPLDDRVVIKGLSAVDTTASGIIIPDSVTKDKPQKGVVVAVGIGRINEQGDRVPLQLKVGDEVLFSKYAPDEISIDGEDYIIASESQILGVLSKN
jgi:chaperonin GroES